MSGIEGPISAANEILESTVGVAPPRRSLIWGAKWAGLQIGWQFVAKVARGLIVPKLLPPAEYGLFASLGVLLGYAQFADFGVKYQLAKRLPYALGSEGEKAYRELTGQGGIWILATSLVVAAGLWISSYFQQGEHAWFYRPALQLLALLIVFSKARDFLGTALVAREEFRATSVGGMIVDGVALLATLVLLVLYGVIGAVCALLVAELAGSLYYLRHFPVPSVAMRFRKTWQMIREGVLLLVIALLDTALMTVDQIFLLKFFSKEQFGIYSLGLFAASIALSISGIFLTAIQPRVLGLEGEGQRVPALRVLESSLTLYALSLAGFLAVMIPSVSVAVHFYLPKYESGIPTYVLLAGLALVRGPAILLRPFYLARNREKRLLAYQVMALAVAVLLNTVVVLSGAGIASVAAASLCAYALMSTLMCLEFERLAKGVTSFSKYAILILGSGGVLGIYAFLRWHDLPGNIGSYAIQVFSVAALYLLPLAAMAFFLRRHLIKAAQPFFSQ